MNVEETIVDCRADTAECVRVFRIQWALSITRLHNSGTGFCNSRMTRMYEFRLCKRTTRIHNAFYSWHMISQTKLIVKRDHVHPRAHVDPDSRTGLPVHPGDREGSMSATILGFDKAEPVCERTTQNDLL